MPGLSALYQNNGEVFLTYSCFARGLDPFDSAYQLLDLTAKGRDEDALDWPMAWLRRHDGYDRYDNLSRRAKEPLRPQASLITRRCQMCTTVWARCPTLACRKAPMHTLPKLIDTQSLIDAAARLEPIPASLTRLANLVTDPNAKMAEIVEVITFDQALTGSLLRQANSASSASTDRIGTVREAVIRMGTATTLALAMSSSVSRKMNTAVPEYGLAEGQLWAHSVASSLAAETIRSSAAVTLPGEIVTAALLHDIGKQVMAKFLDPAVLSILASAEEIDQLSRQRAETAVLEVHHGELAGLVVQNWGLPESIQLGVQYHHTPEIDGSPMCFAVYLADVIAHEVLHDAGPRSLDPPADIALRNEALWQVGISSTAYDGLVSKVTDRYKAFAGRYLVAP